MDKKPSPTPVRLDKNDEKEMKFLQQKLSVPGMDVNRSDVLRRALHEFAKMLRSQDVEKVEKN